MFRRFYGRVGVYVFEAMYICVNACAKTCTCIYLNIACYHPYSTRLFYMPSSHFLCPSPLHVLFLCFFFTLLTLFVRFACQSALNIVALLLQLLPPPPPLCLARTNRWAADKEIVVAKRREGGSTRFPLLTLPHYAFYRLHIKVLFTIQAVDLHLPTVYQFVGERYYK